jgi:hypothetical protein
MSNGTPSRARGRIALALTALFLVACGSGPTAPAPSAAERADPRFDGSAEPPPAAPDTGGASTDGNYHSPHV